MKKKIILIIVAVLIVVIAAGTGVVTFAVWDNKKEDLSVEFGTGSDYYATVNTLKLDDSQKGLSFRPDGMLADKEKSTSEKIVLKFDLTLRAYTSVKYTVGEIMLTEAKTGSVAVVANAYMEVKVYKVDNTKPLTDSMIPANAIAAGGTLEPGVQYMVTFKFKVDSTSDLLTTDMQKAKIQVVINFEGQNLQDGGNA